ncbi:MAG: D-glycero-beta-D-manno-heptose-7-phosphate kinase [Ignavibacteria bacterium]
MIKTSNDRLNEIRDKIKGKRIAVIGDMMLDSYFWGNVKRISPEAPVPVVEVENEFSRFGGAANVALNISTLGGYPIPVGVIGNDNNGNTFMDLMRETDIDNSGIITDDDRPTTTKTRVIANNQHVVRVDKENKTSITDSVENKIINFIEIHKTSLDGIILQDYNKGVLTQKIIKTIIEIANNNNIIITVDPKFNNFFEYKNVTVFKPNRKETEDAFGIRIFDNNSISNAGSLLLEKLKPEYALLTLGEEGIAIFNSNNHKDERRIPTKARKVRDVSGAGDTVISALTIALSAGADILEASYLANYSGGLVCEEVGIVPIYLDKLFDTVKKELAE